MTGCRPFTDAEIVLVSGSFAGRHAARDRALFVLGVKTGFRISELLSLRVRDIWQDGEVARYVTVERRNVKGKAVGRTLPLHETARQAIEAWMCAAKSLRNHDYLFRSGKGANSAISRQQAHKVIIDACKANGLSGKVATHSMRKTFATKVHKALGNDVFKTQRALGHRSIQSTLSYLEIDQDEINAAILGV